MRRSFFFLALVLFALGGLAAACGDDDDDTANFPSEVQLADEDNGSSVQLAQGGKLIVALASNPTTGYSWSVGESSDAALVLQGEPQYVPAGSTTPVAGAGGTEVFTFEAQDAGTANLVLEYRRPFEPDAAPEQTFSVTVEIR
jgi:inhibitor of cysteine peptidase